MRYIFRAQTFLMFVASCVALVFFIVSGSVGGAISVGMLAAIIGYMVYRDVRYVLARLQEWRAKA